MTTSRNRRLSSPPFALKMSGDLDPNHIGCGTIQRPHTTTRRRIRTSSRGTVTMISRTLAMGLFVLLSLQNTSASSAAVSATASVASSARSIRNRSNSTTYQSKPSQSQSLTPNDADSAEPPKKKKRRRKKKDPVHSTAATATTTATTVTAEDSCVATDLLPANPRVSTAAAMEMPPVAAAATCLENDATTATATNISTDAAKPKPKQKQKKRRNRKVSPGSGFVVAPHFSAVAAKATDASSSDVPAATVAVEPRKHVTPSKKPKGKATKTTTKATTTATTASAPLSREAASSLRRIQGEWKDAVQAGIAFDWKKGKPVSRRKGKTSTSGEQQQTEQHVWVGPLSKNIWIWHFSVTGVPGSVFGDGIYHGRIVLPSNYPAQPPRIQVWTPSGRFVPRADICLSASSYHPESWSASWTIRTLVEALRLHMITPAQEIGGINESYEERLAKVEASRSWRCRVSPSIIIDHAHMVAQGLFPAPVTVANDDPSESELQQESTSTTMGETARTVELSSQKAKPKQKQRRRQQPGSGTATATATIPARSEVAVPSLFTSLLSPVRLTFLGFAILFFMLNRS